MTNKRTSPFSIFSMGVEPPAVAAADNQASAEAAGVVVRQGRVEKPREVPVSPEGHVRVTLINSYKTFEEAMAKKPAGVPALTLVGHRHGQKHGPAISLARIWAVEAGMVLPERQVLLTHISRRVEVITSSVTPASQEPATITYLPVAAGRLSGFNLDAKKLSIKAPGKIGKPEANAQVMGILAPMAWEPGK